MLPDSSPRRRRCLSRASAPTASDASGSTAAAAALAGSTRSLGVRPESPAGSGQAHGRRVLHRGRARRRRHAVHRRVMPARLPRRHPRR
jgi:hypothetical protein